MAAPAAAAATRVAVSIASSKTGRNVALAFLVFLVAIPLFVFTAAAAVFSQYECAPSSDDFGGTFDGPGSLGGVLGTGVTSAELRLARSHVFGGSTVVATRYTSTAYAPAAGGINCGSGCSTTASGIRVNNGARRAYLIASNPTINKYGGLAYVWPNPYGWRGPFVVADTGGNFDGSDGRYRLDFYTWGTSNRAISWGRRDVRLSAAPIVDGGPEVPTEVDTSQCEEPTGSVNFGDGGGRVVIAPGANRPGVSLQPALTSYLRAMTRYLDDRPLVVTTGTNHNQYSTSGNVSDHWAGFGADFGMGANGFTYGCRACRGSLIAAAALRVAGVPASRALAMAQQGGAHTVYTRDGWRVQVIWLSSVGGDHFNHTHLGIGRS